MAQAAGELNKFCRFYEPSRQLEAGRAPSIPGDGHVCDGWAQMRGMSSGESIQAGATVATATFQLLLRKRPDDKIRGTLKVLIDSKWYELDGDPVDPDGMNEMCVVLIHPCTSR